MKLPYVIVLAHRKGGTGKSTIACNLLAEFSKRYKTTMIDADSQQHLMKFNSNRDDPITVQEVSTIKELRDFLIQDDGLTMIDLGGYDSDFARGVLAFADMIITPLNDSDFELDGLVDFTKVLSKVIKKSGRVDIKPFILANKVHYKDKATQQSFKKYAKKNIYEVFETIIPDRKLHKRILSNGKSVCELEPFSKSSKDIEKLINEIIQKA